jgi:NitT/TauT family transport system substrate-binding protein
MIRFLICRLALVILGSVWGCGNSFAVELNVTQFGIGMYGIPYAVAKEKGYFREIGLDVTGFLTSAGGGTTIRNVLASELPYGEVSLPAALVALKQGLPLTIIHGGVASGADQLWVTRKEDQSIQKPEDLRGKKIGFSGPNGVTDILSSIMLDRYGLKGDVERRAVGSVGAGLTAVREGAVDATYMFEPAWSRDHDKYRLAFSSAVFAPRVMQTVGIARTDYLKSHADLFRGIIAARRKSIEFIKANRDEAAAITAKAYKMDLLQAKTALANVLNVDANYWSAGEFDFDGMNLLVTGLQLNKAIEPGPYDWSKVISEDYLPDDLRRHADH